MPAASLAPGREWLALFPFLALCLVPGAAAALAAARHVRLGLAEWLALSFAVSMAIAGLLAEAAHLLGLSLTIVTGSVAAVGVGSIAWLVVESRRGMLRSLDLEWPGLGVAGAAAYLAIRQGEWFLGSADMFYHVAAVRSLLATGRPLVADPFHGLALTAPDPTSGAWHTMQAVWAQMSWLDPLSSLPAVNAAAASLVALSFWALARLLSGNQLAATGATVLYLAGVHGLDMRAMAYPNRVSLGLAFVGIALFVHLVEERAWELIVLAAAAGYATASVHLGSAELMGICAGAVILLAGAGALATRRRERRYEWRSVALLAGAAATVAAVSLPVVLPRLSTLGGTYVYGFIGGIFRREQLLYLDGGKMLLVSPAYDGPETAVLYALALAAGVVALVVALRRLDRAALGAAALAFVPPVLFLDPLLTPRLLEYSTHMTRRLLLIFEFVPYAVLAWAAGALIELARRKDRRWRWGVAVALLAGAAALWPLMSEDIGRLSGSQYAPRLAQVDEYSVPATQRSDLRNLWGRATIAHMRGAIGDDYELALSDPLGGYQAAAVLPVTVASVPPSHEPFFLPGYEVEQRARDVKVFLAPWASAELRRTLIERYGARWVVLRMTPDGKQTLASMDAQPELFETVVKTDRVALLRIRRG